MPIGFAAAASLGGGLLSGIGSWLGGSEVAGASKSAQKLIGQEYNDISSKLLPFLQRGTTASSVLGDFFGINNKGDFNPSAPLINPITSAIGKPPSPDDASLRTSFQASPGYDYLIKQMTDTVQNSASGKTGAVSGNALRALQTNSAGIANQDWNNYYNQLVQNYGLRYGDMSDTYNRIMTGLGGIAGSGQNAANSLGGFGQTAAGNIGSLGLYGANASAAGTQGAFNSLANLFNSPNFGSGLNYLMGRGQGGTV